MGLEWLSGPNSPADSGGSSGGSGGDSKGVFVGVLWFISLPLGVVLGVGAYFAHGYGLI